MQNSSSHSPAADANPGKSPRRLTRLHVLLAGLVLSGAMLALTWLPATPVQTAAQALPAGTPVQETLASQATAAAVAAAPTEPAWKSITAKSGDTLSTLFRRAGLAPGDLQALLAAGAAGRDLQHIRAGMTLEYRLRPEGGLQALRYSPEPLKTITFDRQAGSFKADTETHTPEIRIAYRQTTINSSLFAAGQSIGLNQTMLLDVADIFGGVVDFVQDVRKGDHFGLVYEEKYLDGKFLGNGRILAAFFINQGEKYTAYYYENSQHEGGYYNDAGMSMRRAFLRVPLDFTKVSSNFNPARLHPLFQTIRPHNGVDYAAPRGTPVYAAGEGKVVDSGFSAPNGNYVYIQHGSKYMTRYLHLQKRMVKAGQHVNQHQVIGLVGSTGYATGPHLHYEFLVNGVHRNPRTIVNELPRSFSLAAAEKSRFQGMTSGLHLQLAALMQGSPVRLAAANTTPRPNAF